MPLLAQHSSSAPDYAVAYNNRGIIYNELEKYEDAIADYSKAIELDPDENLFELAIEKFQKAAELNPNNDDIFNALEKTTQELAQLRKNVLKKKEEY